MPARLFIVVGAPGSGKDLLIQGVNDLGNNHAMIVPKHTSRARRADDGNEMICSDDPHYDIDGSDVRYENYGTSYGIHFSNIWRGLLQGVSQVVVVSGIEAINALKGTFKDYVVLVYVHSDQSSDEYLAASSKGDKSDYTRKRAEGYEMAFKVYKDNILTFDHVLLSTSMPEDLFDQIFRLFRAYEQGLLR